MPKDAVLRAWVRGTLDGQTGDFIVDAFEKGNAYGLVVEWTAKHGKEGEFASRALGVPKRFFEIITTPDSPYELKCLVTIDFDDLLSGERTELDANEIWGKPDNLFYPRPKDEDSAT